MTSRVVVTVIEFWGRFRRSTRLVVVAFFLAAFTDGMAVALIQSLAPVIIRSMNFDHCSCAATGNNETRRIDDAVLNSSVEAVGNFFCPKYGDPSECYDGEDVAKKIGTSVDILNGIGPLFEFFVNPVVGIVCSKIGHRLPFLFGAVLQVAASFLFLFAPNEIILFIARAFQGCASTILCISGLVMVAEIFNNDERANVIGKSYGSAFAFSALVTFSLGSFGYEIGGSSLPMGILVALAMVDFFLRIILDTDGIKQDISDSKPVLQDSAEYGNLDQDGEKAPPKEGSYVSLLCDPVVVGVLIISFLLGSSLYMVFATAPNWIINILKAEQWELGIVLAMGAGFQILSSILIGKFIAHNNSWIYLMWGILAVMVGLLIYPVCRNVWLCVIPEGLVRGIGCSVEMTAVTAVLLFVMEQRHEGCSARGFSLYVASYTLGCGVGPLVGGVLAYTSFMVLYYVMAALLACMLLIVAYIRRLKL